MPRPQHPFVLPTHMPDLSELFDKNILNLTLDRALGGDPGPTSRPDFEIWTNLVRLSDKSIREYCFAREALFQMRPHQGVLSPFYRGIDHLENCVTATHRAVLHGGRLRQAGWGVRAPAATATQVEQLRVMRNHIEHADDKLLRGQIKSGSPFYPYTDESGFRMGSARLTYLTLARCVRKVYAQVEAIRGASV
jgi:hypothetical protein